MGAATAGRTTGTSGASAAPEARRLPAMAAGADGPATPDAVASLVMASRLPLNDEIALHGRLADLFEARGWPFARELALGPRERPDFSFPWDGGPAGSDRFVLEVKVKGGKRAIHDQCARYLAHGRVGALVLATSVASGFPASIEGKDCLVASLGRAWL